MTTNLFFFHISYFHFYIPGGLIFAVDCENMIERICTELHESYDEKNTGKPMKTRRRSPDAIDGL